MNDSQLTDLQPPLIELQPLLGTPLGRRLRILKSGGQRAVFCGPAARIYGVMVSRRRSKGRWCCCRALAPWHAPRNALPVRLVGKRWPAR